MEDLEVFRQIIGDEKFWLYGESYGTQYAQTYAAMHNDHLAGLILDGTVDLTFSGTEYYAQQAQAFNDTLVATLSACNDDPACLEQSNGDAIKAYDKLALRLSKGSLSFRFPLPEGGFDKRQFTLSDFEYVAASQMYGESDRMLFTRLSLPMPLIWTSFRWLACCTLIWWWIPKPSTRSRTRLTQMPFFTAWSVRIMATPAPPPMKKPKIIFRLLDPFKPPPRLAPIIYGDLPCAYWQGAASDLARPDYLLAPGIPTLVLGATADPATPVSHGINVYQHLADGYLITTQGGPHVTFGYGNECPDALVTDFLVNDIVPAQRETTCEGIVVDDYVPVAPRLATSFHTPEEAFQPSKPRFTIYQSSFIGMDLHRRRLVALMEVRSSSKPTLPAQNTTSTWIARVYLRYPTDGSGFLQYGNRSLCSQCKSAWPFDL